MLFITKRSDSTASKKYLILISSGKKQNTKRTCHLRYNFDGTRCIRLKCPYGLLPSVPRSILYRAITRCRIFDIGSAVAISVGSALNYSRLISGPTPTINFQPDICNRTLVKIEFLAQCSSSFVRRHWTWSRDHTNPLLGKSRTQIFARNFPNKAPAKSHTLRDINFRLSLLPYLNVCANTSNNNISRIARIVIVRTRQYVS